MNGKSIQSIEPGLEYTYEHLSTRNAHALISLMQMRQSQIGGHSTSNFVIDACACTCSSQTCMPLHACAPTRYSAILPKRDGAKAYVHTYIHTYTASQSFIPI